MNTSRLAKYQLCHERNVLRGSGILNSILHPIDTIKEAFSPIPTKLNNISTDTLKKYGDKKITAMAICREPLDRMVEGAIKTITLGRWDKAKKDSKHPILYHLSLLVNVEGGPTIVVQKNEVIDIKPAGVRHKDAETHRINVKSNLTLNEMIDKTLKFMGPSKFYDYSALNGNNCQDFVKSILKANNLLTPDADKFLYQDLTEFKKDLENNTLTKHIPKTFDKVTKIGSIVSRLLGKGTYEKCMDAFEMHLKGAGKENTDDLNKLFVAFINNEGFKFL